MERFFSGSAGVLACWRPSGSAFRRGAAEVSGS